MLTLALSQSFPLFQSHTSHSLPSSLPPFLPSSFPPSLPQLLRPAIRSQGQDQGRCLRCCRQGISSFCPGQDTHDSRVGGSTNHHEARWNPTGRIWTFPFPPPYLHLIHPSMPPFLPTSPRSQVVVPAELGYPANDPKHDRVGPKPSTFSGQRALDFVLTNQGLVDKTVRKRFSRRLFLYY